MQSKSITREFLSALAEHRDAVSTLVINLSNDALLDLPNAEKVVGGSELNNSVSSPQGYDLVAANLPLGMGRKKTEIGGSTINARGNWVELSKAMHLLSPRGLCVALVEPTAFGISEGPKFQSALEREGFYLNGVFNTPPNFLATTSIRPVIVVFSREERPGLFVAELEGEAQAVAIAKAFMKDERSSSLHEGMSIAAEKFDGFESLKARLQINRLETQYKDYESHVLGDIAIEMNTARSGESLRHKENSVYVPMIGTSAVTSELTAVTIKHHNIIQVVLPEKVKSQYVAAFFRSDLGLLILRSLTRGAFIPKISKSSLAEAKISVPSLKEQEKIIDSESQLQTLKKAIEDLQRELALNPRNASAIQGQTQDMLKTIGSLTEADRIMSLAREGESGTVEFKESFSLDVKKGTKEKYIELSALKTIVAFLNTHGGVLLIGVNDTGDILGVREEVKKFYKGSNDDFLKHFKNKIKQRIGAQFYTFIEHQLVDLGNASVLVVDCEPSLSPCYLDGQEFYVRTNPATDKLEGPKLVEYVENHFKKRQHIQASASEKTKV